MAPAGVLVLLAFLAAACAEGGEEVAERVSDPGSGVGSASTGVGRAGVARDLAVAETPDHVFRSRATPPPEGFERLEPLVEDRNSGWPSEMIAARVAGALESIVRAQLDGAGRNAGAEYLAPGFRGSVGLRPGSPTVVFDDGTLRIRRAAGDPGAELAPPVELGEQLGELLRPLAGVRDPRVVVHVESVLPVPSSADTDGPVRLEAIAYLSASGALSSATRQLNLTWSSTWALAGTDEPAILEALRLVELEEVRFERPPFAELTRHVLGGIGGFERDARVGSVESTRREDRLVGTSHAYLGMHGMAVGDVDGDGREDLYVAQRAGVPNRLLLQQADGTAVDAAAAAGVDFLDHTQGVLLLDLDGDRARDLLLAVGPDLCIAWNDGGGTFGRRELLRGKGDRSIYSISSADADGDGDLDLYVTRYSGAEPPTPYNDAENGVPNMFWRNEGGRFRLATAEVGLDVHNRRFSLASIWEDLDEDGALDLYVTNDFGRNNFFRNVGGRFEDVAGEAGLTDMAASMGVSCADVDRDGHLDLYVSNMYSAPGMRVTRQDAFMPTGSRELRGTYVRHARGNSLFLGRGEGRFDDASDRAGAARGGWTWGAVFSDYDNDGLPDLYVPNGFLSGTSEDDVEGFSWRAIISESPDRYALETTYREGWDAANFLVQSRGLSWNGFERNYTYWNTGGGRFADVSAAAGLDFLDDGRVACVFDWDGDGRLDLWLRNRTAPGLRFLHNRHRPGGPPGAHWIVVELSDDAPNTEAIGALVTLRVGEQVHRRRVYAGDTFLGGTSRRLHFGVGEASEVEDVAVTWPDGEVEPFVGLDVDRAWRLHRGGDVRELSPSPTPGPRTSSSSGLESAPAEHVASSNELRRTGDASPGAGLAARAPLLEGLPLSLLGLPRFDAPPTAVRAVVKEGRAVYLALWGSWDPASREHLERLVEGRAALEAAGLTLHSISLDRVRDESLAQAVLGELGWTDPAGRANKRIRGVFEMILWHVLGPSEDYGVPLGLLFSPAGTLCCIYVGGADPGQLEADARALRGAEGPDATRWPVALSGGRWIRGPERDLEGMRAALRSGGFRELVAELDAFRGARTSGPGDSESGDDGRPGDGGPGAGPGDE